MPSLREIRRRIRSVRNTSQITKAMEMVSAAKMRRAQAAVTASRPYSERMRALVSGLAGLAARQQDAIPHPLLARRPTQTTGVILITADRGLAGPLNANVIRAGAAFVVQQQHPVKVLAVGRKGRDWMIRHGSNVVAEVADLGDRPTLLDIAPISRVAMDAFTSGELDEVHLIFTQFISTTNQKVVQRQLLPIQPEVSDETTEQLADYIFEPDPATVLDALLPRFVEMQIYQAVLEAVASEHSARMVAMHNATQNAREIVRELTLTANKVRQASITSEMLEIVSGAQALAQAE